MIFQHTLMDEFELRGRWRLVDGDRKTPGVMRFSPEHGIRLDLDQPLEPALEAVKHTFGPRLAAYEVVQGESLDGNPITLFGVEGRPFGTLRSRLMVVGEALTSERALLYRDLVVEFEGLEAFVGLSPISGQSDESSETVTYRQPEPFRVELNETYSISIEHRCAWSASFGQRSLEHRACVRVHARVEMPAAEFFNGPLAAFHRLLELAVGRRVRSRRVRVESSSSIKEAAGPRGKDHSLLFFRQTVPGARRESFEPSDLLFNMNTLGDHAPTAIQHWNARYPDLWPVLAFYLMLDPQYDLDSGLELHFINALSAIEHLHRVTSGRQRGKADTLEMQLATLIDGMPQRAQNLFEPRDEFIGGVVATRSHLLHAQIAGKKTLTGKSLWKALSGLRLILQSGFLQQMELDKLQMADFLGRTREFRRLQGYRETENSNAG
jgi:hypothetical protein